MRPEIDLLRDLGQDAGVHDAGANLGELALGKVREVLEHVVRHDEPSTESPRNSSRSFDGERSCSAHQER